MAFTVRYGNHSLVHEYCLRCVDGTNIAQPAIPNFISIVYCTMRYICLGGMDSQKHRHGGKLFAIGHY
jgi:hypothetical protein